MPSGLVINGLDPILTRSKAFKRQLDSEMRKAQAIVRRSLVAQLTVYPPPVGTYVRTFALLRGWERAVPILDHDGEVMRLINSVTYMPEVQGDQQRPAFQGRWQTVSEIADDNAEATRQAFEDAAARACAWVEKG